MKKLSLLLFILLFSIPSFAKKAKAKSEIPKKAVKTSLKAKKEGLMDLIYQPRRGGFYFLGDFIILNSSANVVSIPPAATSDTETSGKSLSVFFQYGITNSFNLGLSFTNTFNNDSETTTTTPSSTSKSEESGLGDIGFILGYNTEVTKASKLFLTLSLIPSLTDSTFSSSGNTIKTNPNTGTDTISFSADYLHKWTNQQVSGSFSTSANGSGTQKNTSNNTESKVSSSATLTAILSYKYLWKKSYLVSSFINTTSRSSGGRFTGNFVTAGAGHLINPSHLIQISYLTNVEKDQSFSGFTAKTQTDLITLSYKVKF